MKKHGKLTNMITQVALIVLAIISVYYFMDVSTELFPDPETGQGFVSHESSFTAEPLGEAVARTPDPKWGSKTAGPLFLGIIPGYVLFMAIAIVFVLSFGFLIMLVVTRNSQQHRH